MELKNYTLERFKGFIDKAKNELSTDDLVDMMNQIKIIMHENSPFSSEPVDCVLWVKNDTETNI